MNPHISAERIVSSPTTTTARRPHYKFDRLLAKAENNSPPDSSLETFDVETVLNAYKRAKQRMEQLSINSLLATGSNEQSNTTARD